MAAELGAGAVGRADRCAERRRRSFGRPARRRSTRRSSAGSAASPITPGGRGSRRSSSSRRRSRARSRRRSTRRSGLIADTAGGAVPLRFVIDVGHALYRPLYGEDASLVPWLTELRDHIGVLHLQNHDYRADAHWGWPDARGTVRPGRVLPRGARRGARPTCRSSSRCSRRSSRPTTRSCRSSEARSPPAGHDGPRRRRRRDELDEGDRDRARRDDRRARPGRLPGEHAEPGHAEQDPELWWEAAESTLAALGVAGPRRHRPLGADARARAARRAAAPASPGHPVERPADGGRVRRDRARRSASSG